MSSNSKTPSPNPKLEQMNVVKTGRSTSEERLTSSSNKELFRRVCRLLHFLAKVSSSQELGLLLQGKTKLVVVEQISKSQFQRQLVSLLSLIDHKLPLPFRLKY
jgi:hypothetical protein